MALALACGMVPDQLKKPVFEHLLLEIERRDYHFDCGVVGLRKMIDVLMAFDRNDILYKMTDQKDFPSFGDWIAQGATTMWQNWDGAQSRNHIMFGSIGDYLYYGLAGINPVMEEPGFMLIKINPQFPDDMSYLKSGHKTPFGWVKTHWKKEEGRIMYELHIPDKTSADLIFPESVSKISIASKAIDQTDELDILDTGPGFVKMRVPAGEFKFVITRE